MEFSKKSFPVRDYDLAATLTCGQAFRWQRQGECWVGIIGSRWVRLQASNSSLTAETAGPAGDWSWLSDYLQLGLELNEVLRTFPDDEPMRLAIAACRGLRLLRQDPWECLASFILSSTKQIVQIRQIVGLLCDRYGEQAITPPGQAVARVFPSPARLALVSEADLRACKMGFRAGYLLATARAVANSELDLARLRDMPHESARVELMRMSGVGPKIADCVLLFAYGLQSAFPVDVWVTKALRQLYFPRRRVSAKQLHRFAATHFGPNAGYAQQYLFHYIRTVADGARRQSRGLPTQTSRPPNPR